MEFNKQQQSVNRKRKVNRKAKKYTEKWSKIPDAIGRGTGANLKPLSTHPNTLTHTQTHPHTSRETQSHNKKHKQIVANLWPDFYFRCAK